ncbi:hypothetical protein AB0I60_37205 [Actinosynnema sp. NPDC050436]|uniref:hypothetical protein n=1 Tax=Actinosynnema sp. NPDC050436 TaxID=3155659 RepID=UPI0033D47683
MTTTVPAPPPHPLGDRVDKQLALETVHQAQALLGLIRPTPTPAPSLALARTEPPPDVVLNLGLGVDSGAITARYITDPSSRDFDLRNLAVITGMTGQEWPATRRLVEQHLLPLMASARVRYIQVARRGPREADGVDILSDTRTPGRLHSVGAWTLAHEMLDGALVPQTTGDRLCSQHFKAWPLDLVIAELTQGRPYRQVMGYEKGEQRRAERDKKYDTALRTGMYPLREWDGGWDRARARAFLRETFGVEWIKSACTYCPFALATEAGQRQTVARFVDEPDAGVLALAMEFTATALNPTQGLIKGKRLLSLLRASTGTEAVLTAFRQRLAVLPWAVYDVRRTLSPRTDGRIAYARSIRILDIGPHDKVRVRLHQRAFSGGVPVTVGDTTFPDDTHSRAWLRRREPQALIRGTPTAEQFLAFAPATAADKTGPAFPKAWAAASQFQFPV